MKLYSRKRCIVLSLLVLSCLMISSKTPRGVHTEQTNVEQNYIDHEPITITSDAGFSVFSGSGTLEEPYVIEKLNITTNESYGISVSFTTKHFVIRDCYIDATYAGIDIEYVAEGTAVIINNICTKNENTNGAGIQIAFSNKVGLRENVCGNNEAYGILLFFSYESILYRNICNNNGKNGIATGYANNSLFSKNTCNDNGWEGLCLAGSAESTMISNVFSHNQDYGIRIEHADYSVFINNTIEENEACGIYVWETDGCLFNYNWFIKNYYSALYFTASCESNRVFLNNFIENGFLGESQSIDDGNNTWQDEINEIGNFWADIGVGEYYPIDGKSNSQDSFPLKDPCYFKENEETESTVDVEFNFIGILFLFFVFDTLSKKLISGRLNSKTQWLSKK